MLVIRMRTIPTNLSAGFEPDLEDFGHPALLAEGDKGIFLR